MSANRRTPWMTRVGRTLAGALLGLLALTALVHAFVVLLEAVVLLLIAAGAAALILPGRWRLLRRQMTSRVSTWAAAAAAWTESAARRAGAAFPVDGAGDAEKETGAERPGEE